MADLEACYFCGSVPEGALDEYAVVPAALSPPPDQQRSVVLCPSCREKLTAVMEPVVATAERTATDGPGADPGNSATADRKPARDAANPPGNDEDAARPSTDDGGVSVPPADEQGSDDGVTLGTADEDAPVDDPAGSASGAREPDSGSSAGEGGTSAGAESRNGEPPDGAGRGAAAAPTGGDEGREDPRDRDEELLGRNSETYNKVLRLLRNREFPVERHDIEEVAASAYQLDPQEVSDAIDTVIQKGLLVQEGSHLRRP